MNSTFSLKSSIALLVLGIAMIASPKAPAKSTAVSFLIAQQPMIASSIIGLGSSNI